MVVLMKSSYIVQERSKLKLWGLTLPFEILTVKYWVGRGRIMIFIVDTFKLVYLYYFRLQSYTYEEGQHIDSFKLLIFILFQTAGLHLHGGLHIDSFKLLIFILFQTAVLHLREGSTH